MIICDDAMIAASGCLPILTRKHHVIKYGDNQFLVKCPENTRYINHTESESDIIQCIGCSGSLDVGKLNRSFSTNKGV